MTATSGHLNARRVRQRERGSVARGAGLESFEKADEAARLCGCEGKSVEEGTLEVVPPRREEEMAVKSVEGVQVIIAKAKIVVRGEAPGQVSGKCGGELRR